MNTNSFWEIDALTFLKQGGPMMWPIALCSFFALFIIIEKFLYFASIQTDIYKLKNEIFDFLKNNKIKEAIQICDTNRSPIAKLFKAGLIKFGSPRQEIEQSMETVSLYEIPKLERRLSALATIAHISPLLGLLGTVTGMIGIFQIIHIRSASLNLATPGDIAGGISEALITTVSGLIVSIPSYVVYNFCISHINQYVLEMERAATELISFMSQINEAQTA